MTTPTNVGADASRGHTPGPWFPVPYGDGNDTVICKDEAGNQRIAFMAVPGCREQQERQKVWREIKANARLIAAAPELLEVLEVINRNAVYSDDGIRANLDNWVLDKARAAIAKAKGGAK